MKKANIQASKIQKNPVNLMLIFLTLITIYFNASFQDPFNSAKFFITITTGIWLLGYLVIGYSDAYLNTANSARTLFYLLFGFNVFFLISSFLSENFYIAMVGESSRKNGFLLYLFFSVFLFYSFKVFNLKNIEALFKISLALLVVLTCYGFAQSRGIDFANWNNPYNSIIITMGNPNFAAALLAILGVLSFTFIFLIDKNYLLKCILAAFLFFTVYVILLNGSYQGLLSFFIGIVIFMGIILRSKYPKMSLLYLISILFLGIAIIFGMLQKGPLQNLVYKDSISVRGYYWRAGFRMLKENFWFGVGPDNFGNYFRFYRDSGYPLKYGFEITSNNAHNVPIQFFATGGIIVGMFYLLINFYILYKIVKVVQYLKGKELSLFAGLVSAWFAYQAQSLVSIDNIGLAIWGWVLGGAVLGIASKTIIDPTKVVSEKLLSKSSSLSLLRPMFSTFLLLMVLVPLSFLIRGETAMMKSRSLFNVNSNIQNTNLIFNIQRTLQIPLLDPYYKLMCADLLFRSGYSTEAKATLQELLEVYPNSADILSVSAFVEESTNSINTAVERREQLKIWDPWNAKNYLSLGNLYLALGELEKAKKEYSFIIGFAPESSQAISAREKLASL